MKNSLEITAAIDHPELIEAKVEQLAYGHYEPRHGNEDVDNHEPVATISAEVYVSGIVAMNNSLEQINMHFLTCFVFTSIKRKDSNFRIEWSSSLT
jgi:hypothetical protein